MKPYDFVSVSHDGYRHAGQVMSYPDGDTVMVRMVPMDPTTLVEMPLDRLDLLDRRSKPKWVHYAKITGYNNGGFPVDMLRYDFAAPVNFTLSEDEKGLVVAEENEPDGNLIIARASHLKSRDDVWATHRWNSFGWRIEPVGQPTKIEAS